MTSEREPGAGAELALIGLGLAVIGAGFSIWLGARLSVLFTGGVRVRLTQEVVVGADADFGWAACGTPGVTGRIGSPMACRSASTMGFP